MIVVVDSGSSVLEELQRVNERDSAVQAWVARHSDEDIIEASTTPRGGPLTGWTLGVKDVINTYDLPTERGSPIYAGNRPTEDAACVALAREAGALVTGKTVTTEFALFTPNVTKILLTSTAPLGEVRVDLPPLWLMDRCAQRSEHKQLAPSFVRQRFVG